ncbi:hypothetical protein IKG45_03900 [Candidatus Saccharibacteria bacterium]|nr:hypothetical protein [Candidatus Saccharibacteria bacterium]
MKKMICFLVAVFMTAGVLISSGVVNKPALAAPDYGTCNRYATFLMLRAWYYGLDLDEAHNCSPIIVANTEDEFSEFVWKIILNIVYDLFAVVGVIATGYVIYAGYAFLTAGGDPGKAAKAKKALIGAITGILVALSATMIVNTITNAIGVSAGGEEDPENVLNGALGLVFSVAGAIAGAFVVYGGISYITSTGDPAKAARARKIFIYAIIGLLIVLMAYGIINAVVGAL